VFTLNASFVLSACSERVAEVHIFLSFHLLSPHLSPPKLLRVLNKNLNATVALLVSHEFHFCRLIHFNSYFIQRSIKYFSKFLKKRLKIKLSLCLTNYALCNEDIGGVDVYIHIFLTSALDGGEWSVSRPVRFTPWGMSARYPENRRLGGPQSRSGQREEEKILDPTGTRTPTPRSSSS
jgi:hypothetical protein